MDAPRITSFGEVLWDLFPEGARFGGAPANFACHAAAQGGRVAMVSAVGRDQQGAEALEILNQYGIDTRLVARHPEAPTGTVGIQLDEQGRPSFTIHEGSAWDEIAWNSDLERAVSEADAVYFGTLGQRGGVSRATIQRAMETAIERGVPRVLDVNLRAPFYDASLIRRSLELASILKLSDDELREVAMAAQVPDLENAGDPRRVLEGLRDAYDLEAVVMTRGAEGAVLFSAADGFVAQPGIPAEVRDTVGAGDAFAAAFVLGTLSGERRGVDLLRHACEIAATVCAQAGAVPELSPSIG